MNGKTILEVRGLKTEFRTATETIQAVNGLDFTLSEGETLAIVGESGCGKSVTSLSILRLIQNPPGRLVRYSVTRWSPPNARKAEISIAAPKRMMNTMDEVFAVSTMTM